MEDFDIFKIEGRKGDYYDFFPYPPGPIQRNTGYVYIIARQCALDKNLELLYIGTTNDLPKQLKYKRLKNFFEVKSATHVLVFRVDGHDEMTMIKDEIIEKHPSLKEAFK